MEKFDFSKLGGFPLTQDQLAHLQAAWTGIAKALTTTAAPVILSGLVRSTVGTTYEFTAGYVAVAGEVIAVAAGVHDVSAIDTAQIKIVTLTTTLVYDNGSSSPSKQNTVGTIVQDGSGTFLIKSLVSLAEYQAAALRGDWVNLINDATAKLDYKVDRLTKSVTVRGWAKHVQTISDISKTGAHQIGTALPAELRPTNTASGWGLQYTTTLLKSGSGAYIDVIKDASGGVYDTGIVVIATGGQILLVTRKLDAGATLPIHIINFTYAI